jgi:hypothetical protein
MPKPAIWGRYETKDYARLACQRFEDQSGAWHRVRYKPSERYPGLPWTVCIYGWEDEADECDEEGEMR